MAPLIRHTAERGVLIALPRGMDKEEKEADISHGNYASANKEAEFINVNLDEQVQAGHVTVSPLEAFNYLHNLRLSLVSFIPGALQSILKQVLTADPRLGTVDLRNVYLVDAYMRLWVRIEDVLTVDFLIPKKNTVTQIWLDSTSPSPWGM